MRTRGGLAAFFTWAWVDMADRDLVWRRTGRVEVEARRFTMMREATRSAPTSRSPPVHHVAIAREAERPTPCTRAVTGKTPVPQMTRAPRRRCLAECTYLARTLDP